MTAARAVRAVLFDFGGTLDADGVAWKDRFRRLFSEEGAASARGLRPRLLRLRRRAGRRDPEGPVPDRDGRASLGRRGRTARASRSRPGASPRRFLADARACLDRSAALLAAPARPLPRSGSFRTSTGTSRRSAARRASRRTSTPRSTRPSSARRSRTAGSSRRRSRRSASSPSEALFVGDSLPRDMAGALALGMPHVWIRAGEGRACCPGDRVIGASRSCEGCSRDADRVGRHHRGGGGLPAQDPGPARSRSFPSRACRWSSGSSRTSRRRGSARPRSSSTRKSRTAPTSCGTRFPELVRTVVLRTTPHSLESFRMILGGSPPGRLLVATVDTLCATEDFVAFVRAAERAPAGGDGARRHAARRRREAALGRAATRRARHRDRRPRRRRGDRRLLRRLGAGAGPEPPAQLGRLREYLAWLCASGEPIRAVTIERAVDVDRPEDVRLAEVALRASGAAGGGSRRERRVRSAGASTASSRTRRAARPTTL